MRQLVYSIRYSVVQITSSLSNITYFLVRTTLIYYDTKYLVHFTMLYMGSTNCSNDSRKHDDMWLGGAVIRGALISYLPVNDTYTPTTEILLGLKF